MFGGYLIVTVSVVLMGQGQSRQQVVEAERLVIKDSGGRLRATLGPEGQKDGTVLQFYGKDGKSYVSIGILVDSGGIATTLLLGANRNPTGLAGNLLAVVTNFDSSFGVSYGNNMSSFKATDERAILTTSDKRGQTSAVGASGFALSDSGGKARGGLVLASDGSTNIQLLGKDGKVIWKAP